MIKKLFYIMVIALLATPAFAQKESHDVRKGNRQYNKEQYTDAETNYRKGLDKNQNSFEAHFNLGDALYRQQKYPEAQQEWQKAGSLVQPGKDGKYSDADKKKLAQVHHNIGNAFYAQQQYDKAVNEYKSALMANPKDDETRYNLVKAMQMLQQQQNQQQQNQDNKDQQQNQDQQQQQQNQDQQDQKDQQNQDQQQEQQDQDQMDKDQAQQILQALQQDEQDTQEKAKRQQSKTRFRTDQDW